MFPAREMPIACKEERRSHRRYPVGLEVRYRSSRNRIVCYEGSGTTRDFSEGGVFFQTDRVLPAGVDVELHITWPVQIEGRPALQVLVVGRTVRTTGDGTAVKIAQCEFRTGAVRESLAAGRMNTEN